MLPFSQAIKSPHKAGMLSCFIVIICCIQSSPVQLLLKQVNIVYYCYQHSQSAILLNAGSLTRLALWERGLLYLQKNAAVY